MPVRAFVFDAYGTLFDVHAAIARHRSSVGPDADRISELWRTKQLEYTWTLTLIGRYEPFWRLTERALDFALARFPSVDPGLRPKLLDAYRELGAFSDARGALNALKAKACPTAILSNGSPDMLAAAVTAAGFGKLLDHVLSVDTIRIYKPQREVYALATKAMALPPEAIGFVSSNRWDVAGAVAAGMTAIWINRGGAAAEYGEFTPAATLKSLAELTQLSV